MKKDTRQHDDVAAALGSAAFAAGKMRIPAHDRDFVAYLSGKTMPSVLDALDSWLAAWDAANLAAPWEKE